MIDLMIMLVLLTQSRLESRTLLDRLAWDGTLIKFFSRLKLFRFDNHKYEIHSTRSFATVEKIKSHGLLLIISS